MAQKSATGKMIAEAAPAGLAGFVRRADGSGSKVINKG
jgi:hypothetical protein